MFLARTGKTKEEIKEYVISAFGYDLSTTVAQYSANHRHDESCMDTLPKALVAFFEGVSYEDVIRNAISMGGDTDTIAAIAGAMADAFYGIPEWIESEGDRFVGGDLAQVLEKFAEFIKK
jgi:type I restriction enzyme M protein